MPFMIQIANAGEWNYEYEGFLRGLAGYAQLAHSSRFGEKEFHFPLHGEAKNKIYYETDSEISLGLAAIIKAETGTGLENLNQGRWGEEAYAFVNSDYGDFYVGQMPNVAIKLGVNAPAFSVWQFAPEDITDYVSNPNWRQRDSIKYYNTLDSTLINTDGSSFKISYLTPEFYNTTLGISYIPENNAKDGLTSKFAPYYNERAFVFSLYNHHEFDFADTEFYLSFADYHQSHSEYAGGVSIYRKGWTLFGSYRQTEVLGSDYNLSRENISKNKSAWFDGFRNSKVWSAGIGYEWWIINSSLSYFESRAEENSARNRIISLQNALKLNKNITFYNNVSVVDFQAGHDNINPDRRGLVVVLGAELNF